MKGKAKEGMIDNRMVNENHQQGIERVKMRKGDLVKGIGGKLMGHSSSGSDANFKRSDNDLTPRKA